MSNLHRKHPVSIAVSMALLAAAAQSAVASPRAGATADNPGAQTSASQAAQTTPSPAARKAKPNGGDDSTGAQTEQAVELSTVTVIGVRASQMRAIELKRMAPDIQDSISAESIGQLPDTTITDALQRITGVQIDRNAGEGTQVDVRGLPQVGTMLNGEVFITPDQITSQQPNFETLPATLFNQVDVIKSPTAGLVEGGISGALDLHTFRPWDLPHGFTYSYSADAERGGTTRKTGPEASGLVSFNDNGRWGLLVSGDFSDTTRTGPEGNGANAGSSEGLDQYGVVLNNESAPLNSAGGNYGGYTGFVAPWNGLPIPSQIVQNPDGSVDVNGDGKSNGVFMGSQNIGIYESSIERKRESGNASFQMDLGDGFTLTSDYFYAHQRQWNRNVGLQFNSTDWQGATYVPLQSMNTGATSLGQYNTPAPPPAPPNTPNPGWGGSQIYTTQVYEKWPGDVESYSQIENAGSTAKNANIQVDFNNGGDFKGTLRAVRETASQEFVETDLNISDSDGCLWPDATSTVPCTTFVYPAQLGGDRVFNPIGIPEDSEPITANFTGRYITVGMPASMASNFANPNGWSFKTIESSGDYNDDAAITALRFDGHYDLHHGIHLDFGVRNSIHTADNYGFTLVAPVYGGMGASDPNGCLVRYVGADVILAGNSDGSGCTAGNSEGYFRAGPLSAIQMPNTAAPLSKNWQEYTNLLGSGINFWAVNPSAMDNPIAYWKSLYPQTQEQEDPGNTWAVWMKETSAYLQADFGEQLGSMPFTGNVGVRVIHTSLDVTQHLTGAPGLYGTEPADVGTQSTRRSYYDVLPDLNLALDLTDKLTFRLAASKNMMPLDLATWGGGLELNYSLQYITNPDGTKTQLYEVAAGNSNGNPSLRPWRSTNYGASLEYYINPVSMVSLELFRINVDSFIENGNVQNCDLPDEDGVVRHRCITISEPVQGGGDHLQGAEFDYRQGFTFLPGLLSDTGMEVNATYAPGNTGEKDLAGHSIPFPDNSAESGNFILWFQGKRLQVRLAYNYRSKRAYANNVGSIVGMEEYEAPQKYLDASVDYKFSKYATLFVNGTNLTNEYERFYLVWPSQEGHANFSERMYTVGLRGQW